MSSRITIFLYLTLLAGCASAPYHAPSFEAEILSQQSKTQSMGSVTVTASVPSPGQAEEIFAIPVYDRGIQPVWLSIENRGSNRIRYIPTGTDPEYFSPLEVAYMHRKKYSKEGLKQLEMRMYDLAVPRFIPPGETGEGSDPDTNQGTQGSSA